MGVGRQQRAQGSVIRFLMPASVAACLAGLVSGAGLPLQAEAQTGPAESLGLRVLSESELPDLQLAASDGSWIGQPPMTKPVLDSPAPSPKPTESPVPPTITLLARTPDRLAALGAGESPQRSPVAALGPATPTTIPAKQAGTNLSARPVTTVLTALSPKTLPRLTGRPIEPELGPGQPADSETTGLDGEQLASAVQSELNRLNCYKGKIDGDWGGGSQKALSNYYSAAKTEPATTEPTEALLRELIGRSDGRFCPDAPRPTSVPKPKDSNPKAAARKVDQPVAPKPQADKPKVSKPKAPSIAGSF